MRRPRQLRLPAGEEITVPVTEGRGQRRLRLTLGVHGSFRCSVPPRTPERVIERFLAGNAAWAETALADWRRRSAALGLARRADGEDEHDLRRRARTHAEALVARRSAELGVEPTRVRIGDPRSRWGSASSAGTLSFSFRLVLAPAWVFDYVVCHEVAHLREPSHSTAFWALVDGLCARRVEGQRWLREHGPELHAWPCRG